MTSKNSPYIRLILGIVLIIVLVMTIKTLSGRAGKNNIKDYKSKIEAYKSYNTFNEVQKETAIIPIVGFWKYDKPPVDSTPGITDCIEIKRNGIVWRVTTWKYMTSTGDTAFFMHALTSYLRPFANKKDDPEHLILDNTIIRQTYMGKDTCYGTPKVDTTWEMTVTSTGFKMENQNYIAYDTSDLKHFFPDGSIKNVDRLDINACHTSYLNKNFRELAYIPQKSNLVEKEAK
jgi:hypothetical protein